MKGRGIGARGKDGRLTLDCLRHVVRQSSGLRAVMWSSEMAGSEASVCAYHTKGRIMERGKEQGDTGKAKRALLFAGLRQLW